jgi:hypothetical protein
LQAISGTPAGICVACTAGYTVDADTGITYNLKAQKDLYNMVEEVWENAMNELHLFQRGPTHQGTKHCIQVLENLNVLLEEIKTQKGFTFNIAVRVGLSIAAALHDIGKGDIVDPEGKSHAKNGAQVIKQRPDIFLLDLGFSDFVSEVVNTHAPEGRHPPIIDNVTAIPIKGHGVNMTCSTDQVKKACSLFQLADTMDTTKDRVSDSVLKVLSQLYSYPCKLHTEFIYKKNVIENRKKIDSVYPEWVPFPCIRVKTTPAVITEVEYQIKRENQDLSDTGAEGVLSALKWFSKLGY